MEPYALKLGLKDETFSHEIPKPGAHALCYLVWKTNHSNELTLTGGFHPAPTPPATTNITEQGAFVGEIEFQKTESSPNPENLSTERVEEENRFITKLQCDVHQRQATKSLQRQEVSHPLA